MAEKYGVIPPKFTKAWWSYFWDYYKWHVIATLFAVMCIAVTAVQCATSTKYDLTVTYAGNKLFTDEEQTKLQTALAPFIEDIDGNGENSVFFQSLTISNAKGQEEYDYAMRMKLDLEFQNDCSFIYLLSKEQLELMMSRDYTGDLYVPAAEWAPERANDESVIKGQDGVVYAVDISNSKLIGDLGLHCDGTYALLKQYTKDSEENKKAYESSLNILKEIIK